MNDEQTAQNIATKEQQLISKLKVRVIENEKLERLRDEFAMAALNGLTSATDSDGMCPWNEPKDVADCAYSIADAMLKARESK